jgi:hypothetical protein
MSEDSKDQLALLLFDELELPPATTTVLKYLMLHNECTYEELSEGIQLSSKELSDSLVLLFYDNIISLQSSKFVFHRKSCLYRIRHSQILKYIKDSIGDDAYQIISYMLIKPLQTKQEIIAALQLKYPTVIEAHEELLKKKYLISISFTQKEAKIKEPKGEMKIQKKRAAKAKRKNIANAEQSCNEEQEPCIDSAVVLTINIERIMYDMRTLRIYDFIKTRYSMQAASVISCILNHSDAIQSATICISLISQHHT